AGAARRDRNDRPRARLNDGVRSSEHRVRMTNTLSPYTNFRIRARMRYEHDTNPGHLQISWRARAVRESRCDPRTLQWLESAPARPCEGHSRRVDDHAVPAAGPRDLLLQCRRHVLARSPR